MATSFFLRITINGEGTHGSSPWTGKDPMPVAAEIVSAFGQIYRQVPATEPFAISVNVVMDFLSGKI